ncbi:ABC transporter ATP-binding protein [Endozoicomonas sp. (ex Bugula neritina AB1)]|nr:ABC transporter ATP-binding protein [Endozoicomonas sp. (ex Bugula neritina AB1)]
MFDIVIKNGCLSYDEQTVFEGLNLTLKGSQWTCLLGGSGVGKTSLLRLMAGLPAGKGGIMSGEVRCQDGSPINHRITWMSQQDSLLPWFSVLENTTLGHHLRKPWYKTLSSKPSIAPEVLEQANRILKQVGLQDKAQSYPQNLSGGQRQRVALARTLMENRPVVLMDEPFGALDAITRLSLQDLACELLTDRTVMLITHDPLEALRLGHQVYHLRGHPAYLTDPIIPPGNTPRSLEDKELMSLQGQLLDRLRHEDLEAGL